MKKEFKFTQRELVSSWRNTEIGVMAESYEEALSIVKNGKKDLYGRIDGETIIDNLNCCTEVECAELISPDLMGGSPTLIVMNEDEETIYDNVNE